VIRFIGIVAAFIFGFDALTNFEAPKETVVPESGSSYTEVVPKPTTTKTVEPVPVSIPVASPTETKVAEAPRVIPATPPKPAPETVQQRLNRLAISLGVTTPVISGSCNSSGVDPTMIRGCYYFNSNQIIITVYATMYDDNYVSCIIRHEARHVWQEKNGKVQYANGDVANRAWLEADATAYSGCS